MNVIICDDGLQLLNDVERQQRIRYYVENDLAYVARSPNGKDGYKRNGAFKKASNLNFTNHLTLLIEEIMDEKRELAMNTGGKNTSTWCHEDEVQLYKSILPRALDGMPGKPCAQGNIRL